MKIVELQVEGFKRITALSIRPDGNLVPITGSNGSGKTSVLDSIWLAIAGFSHMQGMPINKDAERARIRVDLGELIISRTIGMTEDGRLTTGIRVTNDKGFTAPEPQKMLDALVGALSFDPLALIRMKPKEQFDTVRSFVKGFDFDANTSARKAAFDKRTEVNRDAKRERAAGEAIVLPPDLPAEQIDEDDLVRQISAAAAHNGTIDARKGRREGVMADLERTRAARTALSEELPARLAARTKHRDDAVADIERQIADLQTRLSHVNSEADIDLRSIRDGNANSVAALDTAIAADQQRLDDAGPLPEPVDATSLHTALDDARKVNATIRERVARDAKIAEAERLEADAGKLTAEIAALDAAKVEAIEKAELPVPGLGFGDSILLLNGIPFDQASDAEQLRTACAIAMASNPGLKVIRVRDGSLLDNNGMALLAEMANKYDTQIWIEKVTNGEDIGFVIEDGHLKGQVLQKPDPEPKKGRGKGAAQGAMI